MANIKFQKKEKVLKNPILKSLFSYLPNKVHALEGEKYICPPTINALHLYSNLGSKVRSYIGELRRNVHQGDIDTNLDT